MSGNSKKQNLAQQAKHEIKQQGRNGGANSIEKSATCASKHARGLDRHSQPKHPSANSGNKSRGKETATELFGRNDTYTIFTLSTLVTILYLASQADAKSTVTIGTVHSRLSTPLPTPLSTPEARQLSFAQRIIGRTIDKPQRSKESNQHYNSHPRSIKKTNQARSLDSHTPLRALRAGLYESFEDRLKYGGNLTPISDELKGKTTIKYQDLYEIIKNEDLHGLLIIIKYIPRYSLSIDNATAAKVTDKKFQQVLFTIINIERLASSARMALQRDKLDSYNELLDIANNLVKKLAAIPDVKIPTNILMADFPHPPSDSSETSIKQKFHTDLEFGLEIYPPIRKLYNMHDFSTADQAKYILAISKTREKSHEAPEIYLSLILEKVPSESVIEQLIKAGVSPNIMWTSKKPLLLHCIEHKNTNAALVLIENGAKLNYIKHETLDWSQREPCAELQAAINQSNYRLVASILSHQPLYSSGITPRVWKNVQDKNIVNLLKAIYDIEQAFMEFKWSIHQYNQQRTATKLAKNKLAPYDIAFTCIKYLLARLQTNDNQLNYRNFILPQILKLADGIAEIKEMQDVKILDSDIVKFIGDIVQHELVRIQTTPDIGTAIQLRLTLSYTRLYYDKIYDGPLDKGSLINKRILIDNFLSQFGINLSIDEVKKIFDEDQLTKLAEYYKAGYPGIYKPTSSHNQMHSLNILPDNLVYRHEIDSQHEVLRKTVHALFTGRESSKAKQLNSSDKTTNPHLQAAANESNESNKSYSYIELAINATTIGSEAFTIGFILYTFTTAFQVLINNGYIFRNTFNLDNLNSEVANKIKELTNSNKDYVNSNIYSYCIIALYNSVDLLFGFTTQNTFMHLFSNVMMIYGMRFSHEINSPARQLRNTHTLNSYNCFIVYDDATSHFKLMYHCNSNISPKHKLAFILDIIAPSPEDKSILRNKDIDGPEYNKIISKYKKILSNYFLNNAAALITAISACSRLVKEHSDVFRKVQDKQLGRQKTSKRPTESESKLLDDINSLYAVRDVNDSYDVPRSKDEKATTLVDNSNKPTSVSPEPLSLIPSVVSRFDDLKQGADKTANNNRLFKPLTNNARRKPMRAADSSNAINNLSSLSQRRS